MELSHLLCAYTHSLEDHNKEIGAWKTGEFCTIFKNLLVEYKHGVLAKKLLQMRESCVTILETNDSMTVNQRVRFEIMVRECSNAHMAVRESMVPLVSFEFYVNSDFLSEMDSEPFPLRG